MKTLSLILLALTLASLPAAAQTTWYVDINGVPPGSGTPGDPYTSIQYAHNSSTTMGGDTIVVAPGVYPGHLSLVKPVRVKSSGGALVTELRSVDLAATGPELEGFTVAWPTGPFLIYQDGGRVIDCIIDGRGVSSTGFDIFGGQIIGCTITGCQIGVRGDNMFSSALEMYGCIAWGNVKDIYDATLVYKRVEYSAGLDGDPKWLNFGPGNVLGEPGMWAVDFDDYKLRPGSPCIDAGDPTHAPDPDGSRADIGALPYDPAYFHGPITYCTAKPASNGCMPAISASGLSSATTPVPFNVDATGIPENVAGIMIYGDKPAATPFQGGTLCIGTPIVRTKVQVSGSQGAPCTGTYRFNFNRHVRLGVNPALVPGVVVFAQYWFRDKHEPAGFGTGLTDAVRFGIGP